MALGLWLCAGCGRSMREARSDDVYFDVERLDGQRAFDEVRQLIDLGLRDSGTPGAERAARHIHDRLSALGLEVRIDAFEDDTPRGPVTFRNVIGRLPGKGQGLILLGSHFDTKPGMPVGFQGANDSGSSTGLLIEMVRVMVQRTDPVGPEIWFVFFDGEEAMEAYSNNDGLHGSKHLARRLLLDGRADSVHGVMVLDMIGDRDLNVWIPRNGCPDLSALVMNAAREEGVEPLFRYPAPPVLDDHVPFLSGGMPAVLLIDFEFGDVSGSNAWWHTEHDTLDKISAESLRIVGRVTLRTLNRLIAVVTR